MKKLILASLCLVFLTGCTKKTATETSCTISDATDSYSDVLLADNDRVTSSVTTSVTNFSKAIEDGSITATNLALEVEALSTALNAIPGVTYTSSIENNVLTDSTTIDYKEADMDSLIAEGLIQGDPDAYLNFLSLSETVSNYEELGLTCTTNKR
ncbi:YehR family protein [Erysipelothrix sp. HDW6C]|uniref:DUF1307 domain-containing protein n=1 Tax=Erysipelothrix sp. HDW6C TaxID=2714930 RepID=UPI001409F3B1|nr:DUF1307 domain-containing protein [Erysipelothrix sp. HDW6C]QIK69229.1 YehR family protein [Erysipelothrix sp. HDW6C]